MQIIPKRKSEAPHLPSPAPRISVRGARRAVVVLALPALSLAVPAAVQASRAASGVAGMPGLTARVRGLSASTGTGAAAGIDWARGAVFGSVGNVGAHALADCAVAAVADIEQLLQGRTTPIDPAPFLAEYAMLARAAGESPGPGAVLPPWLVLRAWHAPGIAGTRIAPAVPVGPGRSSLEHALSGGPLYAVVDLPRAASAAPVRVGADDLALKAWTAATPPSGYSGGGAHVVAVVGYDAQYVDVVTWGYVQPISWALWAHMVAQVWSVTPQAAP